MMGVLAAMLPLLMLRGFVRQMLIAHLDLAAATILDVAVAALQLGGLLALGAAGRLTVPTAYFVMGRVQRHRRRRLVRRYSARLLV